MRSLISLLLCLVFALASISGGAVDTEQVINRPSFHCVRGPLALRVGRSLEELRALGALRNEEVGPLDLYGAETRTLHFDGLRVSAVFPRKNYQSALIEHVQVTTAKWPIGAGIRVGTSVQALSGALKAKLDPSATSISVCGEGDCVVYSLKGGRIAEINYQCYTG